MPSSSNAGTITVESILTLETDLANSGTLTVDPGATLDFPSAGDVDVNPGGTINLEKYEQNGSSRLTAMLDATAPHVSPIAVGVICGLGADGYRFALEALALQLGD